MIAGVLDGIDEEEEHGDGERRLAREQTRALVARALAALPERHRAMLVMQDVDGVPMRSIAGTLSVALFTAYSRLRRARAALEKELFEGALDEIVIYDRALSDDEVEALAAQGH